MAQNLTPCIMCTPGQQCVFCRDDESMAALESEIWGITSHDDVLDSDVRGSDARALAHTLKCMHELSLTRTYMLAYKYAQKAIKLESVCNIVEVACLQEIHAE